MVYPKITVITPSYNQGAFLEETILSVLGQNYPALEYIIVDGGSTDNSVGIIKKYDHKLDYWISEKDKGQSDAINKGFRKATGEIIIWINSDDLLTENALFKIAELFHIAGPEVGLIHGGTEVFSTKHIKNDFGYPDQSIERHLSGMSFPQPSAFVRKKYWDMVGELNTDLHYGMDYDLFSRLSLLCEFRSTDLILSKYRIHPESKSKSQNKYFILEWTQIFYNILNSFDRKNELKTLIELGLLEKTTSPKKINLQKTELNIDWNKCFFYFLSYVLRSAYINSNFKRAKSICKHLNRHYSTEMKASQELSTMSNRLMTIPGFMIPLLRKIKRNRK